jgi:hypothetical protein
MGGELRYGREGKCKGKGPLGRSRQRWKDNIRMNLRKTGWGGVDGPTAGSYKHGKEHSVSIRSGEFLD